MTMTLLLAGCNRPDQQTSAPSTRPAGIIRTAEKAPVRLIVQANRDRARVADPIELTITAQAESGVELHMPAFDAKLGELEVWDVQVQPAAAIGDGQRQTVRVTLASLLPGQVTVPSIRVDFIDRRDGQATTRSASEATTQPATAENAIETEPFTIEVTSGLTGDFDPKKFRDIRGTVNVPVARRWAWAWWTGGALIAAAILAWIAVRYLRKRRGAVRPEKLIPPHDWAFEQLRRLEQERLVEQGLIHAFYFRLSGIVREYIERRFSIMAPERTTDEFLAEVRNDSILTASHKNLLSDFLQAADMVKFARYEPDRDESERALSTARDFIEQTAFSTILRAEAVT